MISCSRNTGCVTLISHTVSLNTDACMCSWRERADVSHILTCSHAVTFLFLHLSQQNKTDLCLFGLFLIVELKFF